MSVMTLKIVPSMTDESQRYVLGVSQKGRVSCSCMAWRFGKGADCKHLRKWKAETPDWAKQAAAAMEHAAEKHVKAVEAELAEALAVLGDAAPVTGAKKSKKQRSQR